MSENDEIGRKFDNGKLEYHLVPISSLKAVADVLTYGAKKYAPDNWKKVPNGTDRYYNAALRHIIDWREGEQNDRETNKNHLAHAICNLMFLYELDVNYNEKEPVDETCK
jgi:hypothetical protein